MPTVQRGELIGPAQLLVVVDMDIVVVVGMDVVLGISTSLVPWVVDKVDVKGSMVVFRGWVTGDPSMYVSCEVEMAGSAVAVKE